MYTLIIIIYIQFASLVVCGVSSASLDPVENATEIDNVFYDQGEGASILTLFSSCFGAVLFSSTAVLRFSELFGAKITSLNLNKIVTKSVS